MEPEWIDQHEAARLLDRSPRTLEEWRQKNRGPEYAVIYGQRVRYRRDAVLRWKEENWVIKPAGSPKYQSRPKRQAEANAA